jgi:hypothetical protein
MNKKGQLNLGIYFVMLVIVLVGIALFNTSAASVNVMTEKQSITDETTNLTVSCYASGEVNESNPSCNITVDQWYDTGDWRASEPDCYISSVTVTNATGTELTLNTDYNLFSSTGTIQMLNTVDTNSTNLGENVLVDYSYCGEGYNTDSGSRAMANLILIFFAMAITFAILEKSGITNLTGWFN